MAFSTLKDETWLVFFGKSRFDFWGKANLFSSFLHFVLQNFKIKIIGFKSMQPVVFKESKFKFRETLPSMNFLASLDRRLSKGRNFVGEHLFEIN